MKNILLNATNSLEQHVSKLQDHIDNTFKNDTMVVLEDFDIGDAIVEFTIKMTDKTDWEALYDIEYQNGKYRVQESYSNMSVDVEQLLKKYYGNSNDVIVDRRNMWIEVLNKIDKIGTHLNTVGNDDWNHLDYYMADKVAQRIRGLIKTYRR